MNKVSYPKVNQSEHKRRSLFNLEGAIERLCTFKRGKEKISILMPCSYGGVAQLGEHLPCKQGVRSSILLISTKGRRMTETTTGRRKSNGLVAQVVRAHA